MPKNGADGIKFFGANPEILKAAIKENKRLGLRSAFHHAQMSVARWECFKLSKSWLNNNGTLVWITRSSIL